MSNAADQRPLWMAKAGAAIMAPLALFVMFEAQQAFRADRASALAAARLERWIAADATGVDEDRYAQALSNLQRSLDILPDNPNTLARLGDLYTALGQRAWADLPERTQAFSQASQHYKLALQIRPIDAGTWAALAAALQAMGATRPEVHAAWSKAMAQGPFEGYVQPVLLQLALADWAGASDDMQLWASTLYRDSNPTTRKQINAMAARYGLKFESDTEPDAKP